MTTKTILHRKPVKKIKCERKEIKHYSANKIAALDNDYIALPDVMTQKTIPVSKCNVPWQEDIEKWPYLQNIKLHGIDAEVELLIGTDAAKVMEQWELINRTRDPMLFGPELNGSLMVPSVWKAGVRLAVIFYVDDCLKSLPTKEEAIQMVQDLTALCSKGGVKISKWLSNSRAVLHTVSENNKAKGIL